MKSSAKKELNSEASFSYFNSILKKPLFTRFLLLLPSWRPPWGTMLDEEAPKKKNNFKHFLIQFLVETFLYCRVSFFFSFSTMCCQVAAIKTGDSNRKSPLISLHVTWQFHRAICFHFREGKSLKLKRKKRWWGEQLNFGWWLVEIFWWNYFLKIFWLKVSFL